MTAGTSRIPTPKRTMFAFDLAPKWAEAFRDVTKKHYPAEPSATAVGRELVQELASCHLTEDEMRKRDLVAFYRPKPYPVIMISAIKWLWDHDPQGKELIASALGIQVGKK